MIRHIAARHLAPADEPAPYYGPCYADRHPDVIAVSRPCTRDATGYVEVHTDCTHLVRLCTPHAAAAEVVPGFVSRRRLAPPALTFERPARLTPDCTHGADCQLHPQENRLHNYDADPGNLPERVWELEQRVATLEARLQGVIETHDLWDGS